MVSTGSSQQVNSPGETTIRIPLSKSIKRQQSNHETSHERGHMVPDALRMHLGSGHPTNAGRRFNDTNDASSQRNLTLNRLDSDNGHHGHDGSDGRCVEFYGYTRLWRLNDTSLGYVRDEDGEQFGRGAGWVRVNTIGGDAVNIGIVSMFEAISRRGHPVASQPDRHTVWFE